MRYADEEFAKLVVYLGEYSFRESLRQVQSDHSLRRMHAAALSLVTWQASQIAAGPYFSEAISDIIQTFPIYAQGFYKPTATVLRSSIENFHRDRLLAMGEDPLKPEFRSVELLLRAARGHVSVAGDAELVELFARLSHVYGELCLYVHSAGTMFLDLQDAVARFPRYAQDGAVWVSNRHIEVCRVFNTILGLQNPGTFVLMPLIHRRLVLSAMTREFRRELWRRIA